MQRFTEFIQNHSRPIIVLSFLFTLVFAAFLPSLRIENAPGKFGLSPDHPVFNDLKKFESQFGSSKVLILGIESDSLLSTAGLEIVKSLTRDIFLIAGVRSVHSLANAKRIYWVPALALYSPRLGPLYTKKSDAASIAHLQKYIKADAIYEGNLISHDGRHLAIIIELYGAKAGEANSIGRTRQLISAITATFEPYESKKLQFHLAGPSLIDVALQDIAKQDLKRFGSLSAIFIVALLSFLFKNWKPVALASSIALTALVWSLGILSMTGTPLSVGLAMMVPLILAFSIAYSIHYLEYFFSQGGDLKGQQQIFCQMISLLLCPSVLTGLTTAIGFFSLGVSDSKGIQEIGFYIALGVLACIYLNNIFLPAILYKLTPTRIVEKQTHRLAASLSLMMVKFIEKNSKTIVWLAVGLTILALAGIYQLRLGTNHLYYFKKNAPLRKSFLFVDKNFGGSIPLEIVVSKPRRQLKGFILKLDTLTTKLRALEGMGSVHSAIDFLKMAERSKPQGAPALADYFDFEREIFPAGMWKVLIESESGRRYLGMNDDVLTFRLACRVFVQDSEKLQKLLQRVESLTTEYLPQENVMITGLVPIFVRIDRFVVGSQIDSFGVALVTTLLLLSILCRSWRLGLLAMSVNVLPVLLVLGFMGWMGIPLDISTVMIASIAIGIVVDDTIHFLYRYRQEARTPVPVMEGIKRSFAVIGSPIVMTSIVLSGGFFVMAPSDFLPTSYFGLLSGLTVIIAIGGDLLLLPALMKVFEKFYQPTSLS